MNTDIEYIVGDATNPVGEGVKVVVHCCNSIGGWGAGFVLAVSKKSMGPENAYREWYRKGFYTSKDAGKVPFEIGKVQFAPFFENVIVCNLIGQEGVGFNKGIAPIRYEAIREGLDTMRKLLGNREYSVHMPRMGCGLAGGVWEEMEAIIKDTLCNHGKKVTVYDFK